MVEEEPEVKCVYVFEVSVLRVQKKNPSWQVKEDRSACGNSIVIVTKNTFGN